MSVAAPDHRERLPSASSNAVDCEAPALPPAVTGSKPLTRRLRQHLWAKTGHALLSLDGQPRLILRPHLEILHDQVAAVHGATWGALPEDALFYAQQRGLAPDTARSLIIEGKARALLERALPNIESDGEGEASSSLLSAWLEGDWLPQAINAHLAATTLQESA